MSITQVKSHPEVPCTFSHCVTIHWFLPALELCITEIIQYVLFCMWLHLFNLILVRSLTQYQFLKVPLGAPVAKSLGHTHYDLILILWHL